MNQMCFFLVIAVGLFFDAAPPSHAAGESCLSLKSSLSVESPVLGEPIYLEITVTNKGKEALFLPSRLGIKNCGNLRVNVLCNKTPVKYVGPVADCTPLLGRDWIKSGEKWTWVLPFPLYFAICQTGNYEVTVYYEANDASYIARRAEVDEKLWVGEIRARPIKFAVREPQGADKETYDYFYSRFQSEYETEAQLAKAEHRSYREKSDCDIRHKVHRTLYLDASNLLDEFPSSLYTAYALHATVKSWAGGKYNPKLKQYKAALELIPLHHPDFVFIDEVHEMLGDFYKGENQPDKAQLNYEKALKLAKSPELKARVQECLAALAEPAAKP